MSDTTNTKTEGLIPDHTDGKMPEDPPTERHSAGRTRAKALPKDVSEQTRKNANEAIEGCLAHIRKKLWLYKTCNGLLIGINISFSAVSAIVAGGMGVGGQRAAETMPGGWQLACYIAAGCALLVTISSAFMGAFKVPETVTKCMACQTELANLKIDFADSRPDKAVAALKRLRKTYNDILAGVL